jgi:hypothetical protein
MSGIHTGGGLVVFFALEAMAKFEEYSVVICGRDEDGAAK